MKLILASTSPARQLILRNAGLTFTSIAPHVDERRIADDHPRWTAHETAAGLAAAKATKVSLDHPEHLVIGADQVLEYNGTTYSKPQTIEHCRQQLLELRGHEHHLISAICCSSQGIPQWRHSATAKLRMRQFTDAFLEHYLIHIGGECLSSVGGYKIEAMGLQLFDQIEGDHFTILGLPLLPLLSNLRSLGIIAT